MNCFEGLNAEGGFYRIINFVFYRVLSLPQRRENSIDYNSQKKQLTFEYLMSILTSLASRYNHIGNTTSLLCTSVLDAPL